MPHDPCMFCGNYPCNCAGKKPQTGMKRKSLPKPEPVAENKVEKPAPIKRAPKPRALQPAPSSLKREPALDPELQQVLRTFDYLDMLHPDEKKKYAQYLSIPKTTGRLVKLDNGDELVDKPEGGDNDIELEDRGDSQG